MSRDRGPSRLWRALFEPSPTLTDPVERRHMRVVAGVGFPLVAFALLELATAPVDGRAASLVVIGLVATSYALARTTMSRLPPLVLTLSATVIPYYGLLTPEASTSGVSEIGWSLLVPLLAGLALPARTVLAIGTAHLLGLGFVIQRNAAIPSSEALVFCGLVALVTAVTVVVAAVREGHEEEIQARAAELEQAARDLERTVALTENTVDAMGDGLLVADGARKIRSVNPALCEALGYAAHDLVGEPLEFVLLDDSDDTRIFQAPLHPTPGTGTSIQAVFRTREGDELPMACRVTRFRDDREVGFGLVVIARDMRETLRVLEAAAEAEAHRAKADEIRKAHSQLLATQAQLVQAGKLAALGELAGAVAHEVNNPLGAALLATDLAEEALEEHPPDLPTTRQQLALIQEAIRRCRAIIDGLLDFGRQSSGTREEVDLVDVVDSTLQLVGRKLQVTGAEVVVDLPDRLPAWGDRNQLGQVVLNLVLNASQALDGPGTIRITGSATKGRVRLDVADTGRGMDTSVARRIFEPFFTTKPRGKGTGLGLSISYGIVAEHDGRIEVRSTPGEGATFTLDLPGPASGHAA